ncbi:hypothetical protein BLNAU_21834 [Blattamonas nauphoetae]|uniref:Uncharacterized protein n=1 Tax=Blattamonas nauphoetae TaxID=2049346 RepID=A0ABQ9WUT3_9EUKA|nr:hypothetical protein BLNAU_21834 [Blattamonas nauphoetae]
MKRKSKQGSLLSSQNRAIQDEASSASKVTHGNMHTLRQQESIATRHSASPTTVSHHQPTPGYIKLSSPFLSWCQNEPVAADRVSPLFVSLVSLVRDNIPFDDSLLRKVTSFLSVLKPTSNLSILVKDFKKKPRPNSTDSVPLFIHSMAVLLSSSHASIIRDVFAYLHRYLTSCSAPIQLNLLNSDLISIIFSTHCLKDLSALDDQLILRPNPDSQIVLPNLLHPRNDVTASC